MNWTLIFKGNYWGLLKTEPLNFGLIERKYLSMSDPGPWVDGWYDSIFSGLKALVRKELESVILREAGESMNQEPLDVQVKTLAKKVDCLVANLAEDLLLKLKKVEG